MFSLPDFSKFTDVVGDALKKAKDDLEKGVDTALGIDTSKQISSSSSSKDAFVQHKSDPAPATSEASVHRGQEVQALANHQPTDTKPPAVKKKVVKRVVKKAVKADAPVSSTDQTNQATAAPSAYADSAEAPPTASSASTTPVAQHAEQLQSEDGLDSGPSSSPASFVHNASHVNGVAAPHAAFDDLDASSVHANGKSAGQRSIHMAAPSDPGGQVEHAPAQPYSQSAPDTAADAAMQPAQDSLPPIDTSSMDAQQLADLVQQLQASLTAREQQLLRQAEQMSQLQQVVAGLQEKNEELALRSARISEQELEEMRAEFEQRLGVAERKAYALSKERDALKKGSEKLTEYSNLIKEKDAMIEQVMDEGKKLAAKQSELEGSIKKLRAQLAQLELERDKLSARLASEEQNAEALRKARAKAERDLAAHIEQAKADLEAQQQHYEAQLQRAKAEQVDAEGRARDAASQGLARRLKEAEARSEALAETVAELREALDRQRQAADLREEMLKQDVADLERRCHAAELRHQDISAKIPEASRPLLRQIEAMQAAAEAQSEAWSAAERTLNQRIVDAEAKAAAATERERLSSERSQALQSRTTALEAALQATRAEVKTLHDQLQEAQQQLREAQEQQQAAQRHTDVLLERIRIKEEQLHQAQAEAATVLEAERGARQAAEADAAHVQRECEQRIADLEARLQEQAGPLGLGRSPGMDFMQRDGPQPPAMAAPGYRWMLVKEGEQPVGASTSLTSSSSQQHLQQRSLRTSGSALSLSHGLGGSSTALAADGGLAADGRGLAYPGPPGRLSDGNGASTSATNVGVDALVAGLKSSGSMSLSTEVESLRMALRLKTGELASMQARVQELTATCNRLSEELVAAAQQSDQAADALHAMEGLQKEVADLKARYLAAVELLGERDEQLEELRSDLMDVKNLYREQIEFMVVQLTQQQSRKEQAQ